jgi:hypothetical protein
MYPPLVELAHRWADSWTERRAIVSLAEFFPYVVIRALTLVLGGGRSERSISLLWVGSPAILDRS